MPAHDFPKRTPGRGLAGRFCFAPLTVPFVDLGPPPLCQTRYVVRSAQRLLTQRRLAAFRHSGFWQAMSTFKGKTTFDCMKGRGAYPWKTWQGRG